MLEVVCVYMSFGRVVSFLRKYILKVPYVSLVNLIAAREVVPELVADGMTVENVQKHLAGIVPGGAVREAQLAGYAEVIGRLGKPGAPRHAAEKMLAWLKAHGLK